MNIKENEISFEYSEEPSQEDYIKIKEGIIHDSIKNNMDRMTSFSFVIKDRESKVLGGVIGYSMYGLLYTDMLWVEVEYRKKGWGTKLLSMAEELGKKRGCTFTCLVTMSWQALPFYQKHGYNLEFVREGFANKAKMYLLRKSLTSHH